MAAPDSAYQTEKYRMRQGTAATFHRIAKYTGRHNSIANVKLNFHLDYVFAIRKSGSDYGFVGMVLEGSANAGWRSSSRLSAHRIRRGGTDYRLLLDGGLNIQGYATGLVVKYAFCNYFRLDITAYGAPYEGCTVHAAIKQTSSSSSADAYNTSGSVGQAASKVFQMVNRGGYQYWDKAGTYAVVVDVSNAEGTRTYSATAQFLPPLDFDAFIPVSNSAAIPDKSSEDIKTFLIDSVAVDEIVNSVKGLSEGSLPMAIAFAQGDDNAALLGEGRVSGEASDTFLQNYYNYVKSGTGSYTKAPDGLYVCETRKTAYVGSLQVYLYYGVQIRSGRIAGVFRARTPQMPDTRPTLTLNISVRSLGNNKYTVSISLSATGSNGSATVTINSLYVRKTPSGAAMSGQFTQANGTMVVFPVTLTYNPGGLTVVRSYTLTTTTSTPFWVTANATCSSSSYKFSNPGGSTDEGGSIVTPVG